METFSYLAYNKEGLRVEGLREAPDIGMVKAGLKGEGLVPIRIEKESGRKGLLSYLQINKRIGISELEFFSSQISILLQNGIRIDKALEIVRNGIKHQSFKKVIDDLYKETRRGVSVSKTMEARRDIFDPLYISVVAIGEKTGRLGDAFEDLERTLKFTKDVGTKIKQAVFYPSFILAFCVVATLFIFNFIIPRFSVLFDSPRAIPFYTRMLLNVSEFLRAYQLFIPILLGASFLIWLKVRSTEAWGTGVDLLLYRLPIISTMILTLENLRFCSAMKILLKNSVVIDEALGYALKAVGNRYFRKRIQFLQEDVKKGKELSDMLDRSQFFPAGFISLIQVGEHSGTLAEIFGELEARFRTQFEGQVVKFTSLLEPVLILAMGLIVGSIVVMLLMSIVSIQDIKM